MITDQLTNFLYLSDQLPKRTEFFAAFITILNRRSISWRLLQGTKDIWAVDYMAIQVDTDKFIRFTYAPDYLKPKRWSKTITDTDTVCQNMDLNAIKSGFVLDGGNTIRGEGWVVLTDKIFSETPAYSRNDLISALEKLLDARVIIIPREPGEFTGHADGIVRHYDANTVLVNSYPVNYKRPFQRLLRKALDGAGLCTIPVPFNNSINRGDSAHGLYINFLQMHNLVVVPVFGLLEDEQAVRQFEELFGGSAIETIDSRAISREGGVLNCITWNICR